MSALASLAPKVAPLVRLLASDCDGEVIAAARALRRVLVRSGLSFHELAEAVAAPRGAARDGLDPYASRRVEAMLGALQDRRWRLSAFERRFVDALSRTLRDAGALDLSRRQREFLSSLHARIVERSL